jgi:hypothetical protein
VSAFADTRRVRARPFVLASIGLNLALAAALWSAWKRPAPVGDRREMRLAPAPAGSNRTQVVVRRQFFTWAEVESPDYATYIKNLRDIGCPEATIRDIIVADVNQLFARRRSSETVTNDLEWWKPEPNEAYLRAVAQKALELENERRELLTRLLGPGWEASPPVAAAAELPLTGPVLGALSAEVRQSVQQIARRSEERMRALVEAARKAGTDPDPGELARLRQQTRQELAAVLTPVELEEYLLRYSNNASLLRAEARNFALSPDEFRALFRARDALDMQLQLDAGNTNAAARLRREELERQRDAAIQQVLGPERFAEYRLSQDPVYQQARAAAARAGLAPGQILPVYEIQRATEEERQRILNDPALNGEQREDALAEIERDQNKSLRQLLGDEAYEKYRQARRAASSPGG